MLVSFMALAVQAASAPPTEPLQPLAWLLGSCWRGTFPNSIRVDTHCFTPMFGGAAFVRDRHVVLGTPTPYFGETIYRRDAARNRLVYDYYASDGGHSSGTVAPADGGLDFEDSYRGADGGEMTIRSSWVRDGTDAYLVRTRVRQGNGWRELWQLRMTRSEAAPDD